jgi:hypothetical protein
MQVASCNAPRLKREAKKEGNFYVSGDPKLAFAMRIRGINQVTKSDFWFCRK